MVRARKVCLTAFTVFIFVVLALSSIACAECTKEYLTSLNLKDEAFSQPVTFTDASLKTVIGNQTVPEHCAITGKIWPDIGFSIKIPTNWNGRFVMLGCGGACGFINENGMIPYLSQGYAVAADDSGHTGSVVDWSFAYNPPDNSNPHAAQKLKDHGYRSIHETTVLAKKILKSLKGEGSLRYAYYVGASTGGRQGLMNAQRYPTDFNGWLIGMPVRELTGNAMMDVWKAVQFFTNFTDQAKWQQKLKILNDKVYEKCDTIDGVKDGLIGDPTMCNFDPLTDLPSCPNDIDDFTCFTTAQRVAIKNIYEGPRKPSTGERLFWGDTISGENMLLVGIQLGLALGGGFQKFVVMQDPNFDPLKYNWETDPAKSRSPELRAIVDATQTDLSAVRQSGGKIIHWHGWADTLVTPYQSTYYYEDVMKVMGKDVTQSFYKLYMIPGMGHGSGIGPTVDFFPYLVEWVENGKAPEKIIASRQENPTLGLSALTRPLCPYPQVARYKGTGDVNDASNWICTEPTFVTTDTKGVSITSYSVKEAGDIAVTPPNRFSPVKAVEFEAEGVSESMNVSVDFGTVPQTFAVYKLVGSTWKEIYPINECSGVSDVTFSGTTLTFKIKDNSEGDANKVAGKIKDPIVIGSVEVKENGGLCFIATAAYGSYLHPYVSILRSFRDTYLSRSHIGRAFINWYYRVSPPLADFIARHETLRPVVQIVLLPFIFGAFMVMKLGPIGSLLVLTALALSSALFLKSLSRKHV